MLPSGTIVHMYLYIPMYLHMYPRYVCTVIRYVCMHVRTYVRCT
jgi:hypothetical protein